MVAGCIARPFYSFTFLLLPVKVRQGRRAELCRPALARLCDGSGRNGCFASFETGRIPAGVDPIDNRGGFCGSHLHGKPRSDDRLPDHGLYGMEAVDPLSEIEVADAAMEFL